MRSSDGRGDRAIRTVAPFIEAVNVQLDTGRTLADAVEHAVEQFPKHAEQFVIDRPTLADTFGLRDELMFPRDDEIDQFMFVRDDHDVLEATADDLAVDLGELIMHCALGRLDRRALAEMLDDDFRVLVDELFDMGVLADAAPAASLRARWPRGYGVTRLQHASLLYRTPRCTVLVDPHFNSLFEPYNLGATFTLSDVLPDLGAIVISHSHGDHFHVPTLMMFPRDTPIIVPVVPRASMLCEDLAALLRSLGFLRVIPLSWNGPPLVIEDVEIHALPFFGEQPSPHQAMRHADLRNWGNTYVIRTPRFTSWFLIDSGADVAGSMVEVATNVHRRFGTIDVLLSNLRTFVPQSPLYITGGHYWLSLDPAQMQTYRCGRSLTLGPVGVATICKLANVTHFLPYAHWWGPVGGKAGEEESALVDALDREITAHGAPTRITWWRIGDSFDL